MPNGFQGGGMVPTSGLARLGIIRPRLGMPRLQAAAASAVPRLIRQPIIGGQSSGLRTASDTMLPPPATGPGATTAPYTGPLGAREYGGIGYNRFNIPIVSSQFYGPAGYMPNTGMPISGATQLPTLWSNLNTGDAGTYAPTALPVDDGGRNIDAARYAGVGPQGNPADSNVPGAGYWTGLFGHVQL